MELRYSRAKQLLVFLGCVVGVAGFVCMLQDKASFDARGRGWEVLPVAGAGILFFGAGAGAILCALFDRRVQLSISDEGIWRPRWKRGRIPWEDILAVTESPRKQKGVALHSLQLMDKERYRPRSRFAQVTKALMKNSGETGFAISLSGYEAKPEEILKCIMAHLARNRVKNG
jgi:hypothetical protein